MLWPSAMVWAAQRFAGPKLHPFGALALVRRPPRPALGKLCGRSVSCILLHKSLRVAGAHHVGVLSAEGAVIAASDRLAV